MSSSLLSRPRWKSILLLVFLFCVTRALAIAAGVHYLSEETPLYWQLLDLDVLHHHLARGLLHLHSQPPMLNTLVGLAEKIGGTGFGHVMACLQLLLSLCALVCVYLTLVALRLPNGLSLAASLILLLNPASFLFEFDPLYTDLVVALHCFMALALVLYLQRRTSTSLCCLLGLAICLTLSRSSYQWVWIGALIGMLWWQLPESRRQIRIAGLAALALSLLWPLKNQILFHHFSSSTWGPFSMSKHWQEELEHPPVQGFLQAGLIPTFASSDESDESFRSRLHDSWPAPATGFEELDDLSKRTGGATNWNSLSLLRMHDAMKKDISFLLRHDLRDYLRTAGRGLNIYFYPTSHYFITRSLNPATAMQYARLRRYIHITNRACCNLLSEAPEATLAPATEGNGALNRLKRLCLSAIALHLLLLACLASFARRALWEADRDRKVAAMVLLTTIAYSFIVANIAEVGENERFRFETEALALMVVIIFLGQLWNRNAPRAINPISPNQP